MILGSVTHDSYWLNPPLNKFGPCKNPTDKFAVIKRGVVECSFLFSQMLKRAFTEISDFKCEQCDRCFSSKQRLQSHCKSKTACTKVHVPEQLSCPCGEVWVEKTAQNILNWRHHVRNYEKRGFCYGYIHCRKCNHNIKFECKTRDTQVCADCIQLESKLRRELYHPILTTGFDHQKYDKIMGPPLASRMTRIGNKLQIRDESFRAFEYFYPTVSGVSETVDDPILTEYKKNSMRFCVHSPTWAAIRKHSRHCLQCKFMAYTADVPMLKANEDCLYWCYLSPQSYLMKDDYAGFMEQKYDFPDLSIMDFYKKSPVGFKAQLLRLTTDDIWRNTIAWKFLKSYLGVFTNSVFITDQETACMNDYKKRLKGYDVKLPLGKRQFSSHPCGSVDPILSHTGPIRVVCLNSRWNVEKASHERLAENTFYFIMRYVAKVGRSATTTGNLLEFFRLFSPS